MITHIVFWKIKETLDGRDKPALIAKITRELEDLPARIPEIVSLQVGANALLPGEQAADLALLSTFSDWAALQTYQVHPAHQAVASFIRQAVTERRVIDFEG